MKTYKQWNNLFGWLVFLIATITYFCTLEPTASWWDCGEYISTACKLQVGHPPGAPTFQLIGRFFSMFAFGNVENIAMMVNAMSAICSGFTILFLFWTITMLAKKCVAKNCDLNLKENRTKAMYIFAAGIIGSLAYTFSDTFWFSAVEGEVYAMSSLCTAVVFWAMLKWDEESDRVTAAKWIVFIFYIIGLSIGVHLLNLLAITAIVLIYYFKRNPKPRVGKVILAILVSFVIIGGILYVVVPLIVKLAGWFDLFFVNTLGCPFNTGTFIYFTLLVALVAFFWIRTVQKGSFVKNVIVLCSSFLLIGYSTFFILVIRSDTNTPINEGSPSDPISMLAYLNREQYGKTPLLYGPYYNAPSPTYKDASPIYVKDSPSRKYLETSDGSDQKPVYDDNFCTVFPRMWNNTKSQYIDGYKAWGNVKGTPVRTKQADGTTKIEYVPTFGENLRYFFSYQVNQMYLRYLFWNFVGRQNNIEGYGDIANGNWKSGINFIDKARLGDQNTLPDSLKDNPANNSFYFLPLILGIIGLFYLFAKDKKNGLVVLMLFLMTGLAIIVYLNQTTYQPRERDYAYAGSFYAFAIWIGFGVIGVANGIAKLVKNKKIAIVSSFVICLFAVPVLMASEGWDDHNRHGKYAARDTAKNYLMGCLPNAVLISNGDNDTFPLWYIQEVEEYRTDIRVANFMLSASDWYAHQMKRKVYDSDLLPLTLKESDYYKNVNDVVYYNDMGITQAVDVKDFINAYANGKLKARVGNTTVGYFPCKTFKLKVDKEKVLANGIVPPELADKIVDEIVWTVRKNYLFKNDLLLLDLLASFNWDRPLYFTNPNIVKDVFDVDKYCYLDGIVYKFMPVALNEGDEGFVKNLGGINFDHSYDLLVNQMTSWGHFEDPKVVADRESCRNASIIRQNFFRLAMGLVEKGRNDSAAMVIDQAIKYFPNDKIPFDHYLRSYIDIYFAAGQTEKAVEVMNIIHDKYYNELVYYCSLPSTFFDYYLEDSQLNLRIIYELQQKCTKYGLADLAEQYKQELDTYLPILYTE